MHAPMLIDLGIIASALVIGGAAGFLIGDARSRWRRRFEQERAYYRMYRAQADTLHRTQRARIAELEEHAPPSPIAAAAAEDPGVVDDAATPEPVVEQHDPEPHDASELTRIRGIDAALAERLSALGVNRFQDIEMMSAEDELALEIRLRLPAGIIMRDQWRLQAGLLGAGNGTGHDARFGAAEPA